VLFLRFVDVATYRAPRLIGILTLGSLQSPRADLGRAFSATFPSAIPKAHPVRDCETSCFAEFIVWQNDRHHAARFAFSYERPSVVAQAFHPSAFFPFPSVHFEGVLRGRRIAFC